MSILKELQGKDCELLAEKKRDLDLHVLSVVSSTVNSLPEAHFILTGSYAIEALTGNRLEHSDMDANICVANLCDDLPKIDALITGEIKEPETQFRAYKKTVDRLEYDVDVVSGQIAPRRLEIQFVEIVSVSGTGILEFSLKERTDRVLKVPTVLLPLEDSKGREFLFRIKSLPYSIATWAIRISGFALNPKRSLRSEDRGTFKLLLSQGYDYQEVILVIEGHSQRPIDKTGSQIFEQALKSLSIA